MAEPQLLFGASPISHAGARTGALVCHGFTGNPSSMRPVADAFVAAGWSVELPRLPGHGTSLADMKTTNWADWRGEVDAALTRLRANADAIVVVGLSMGGSLMVDLATQTPDLRGVVAINAKVMPEHPELLEMVRGMLAEGQDELPGIGSDIAKPDVVESAYLGTPLAPALAMFEAVGAFQDRLGAATMPLLIMTSPQDHVVPPENSDHLAANWGGPVERVTLGRSYHVATLDYDRELICEQALAFATRVCS